MLVFIHADIHKSLLNSAHKLHTNTREWPHHSRRSLFCAENGLIHVFFLTDGNGQHKCICIHFNNRPSVLHPTGSTRTFAYHRDEWKLWNSCFLVEILIIWFQIEGPQLMQYGFRDAIAKVGLTKFLSDLFWIGMFYHLYNQVSHIHSYPSYLWKKKVH